MIQVLPTNIGAEQMEAFRHRMKHGEPAESPEEYLWRVRVEAEDLPDVMEATVPEELKKKPTNYMPKVAPLDKCPAELLPRSSWEDEVLDTFIELRQYLMYWAARGVGKKGTGERVVVPALKDELGWHVFCLGCPEVAGDVEGDTPAQLQVPSASLTANADIPVDKPLGVAWLETCKCGTAPKVKLILQFDQVMTQKLLAMHVEWLRCRDLSLARGAWIYALLARLDKPLHVVTAALVRDLLRICCSQRAALDPLSPDPERLQILNLLVSIAVGYFKQDG
ncbi:unnamed protein product [Chrysoparadoxa australica]